MPPSSNQELIRNLMDIIIKISNRSEVQTDSEFSNLCSLSLAALINMCPPYLDSFQLDALPRANDRLRTLHTENDTLTDVVTVRDIKNILEHIQHEKTTYQSSEVLAQINSILPNLRFHGKDAFAAVEDLIIGTEELIEEHKPLNNPYQYCELFFNLESFWVNVPDKPTSESVQQFKDICTTYAALLKSEHDPHPLD